MLRLVAAFGLVALLGACSGTVNVPNANVSGLINSKPAPGHYAAMVQTGGWMLKTKPDGFVCSAWTFKTDVNKTYEDAMKSILTRSLQKVDFVPNPLSPKDVKDKGYDAFVAIHQGNADSKFGIETGLFSSKGDSNVSLTSILAITDDTGVINQETVTGKGSGKSSVFFCPSVNAAIAKAAQQAVQDIAKSTALYIRDDLKDREIRKLQAQMKKGAGT